MKKTLTILAVLLWTSLALNAQQGEIIYTDYEPDSCFTFHSDFDTLKLDLDQDGVGDVVMYAYWHSAVGYIAVITTPASDWQWSWTYASQFTPLTDTTMLNGNLSWQYGIGELAMYPEFTHFAFRHHTEDGYHYGWGRFYVESLARICVNELAYCTIPNYPLVWGQTEIQPHPPIIYTDYEPDTCKMITDNHESDFMFDIDHDGVVDMTLFGYTQHGAVLVTIDMSNGFELCRSNENTVLNADTIVWFGSDDLSNGYPLDSYRKSVGFRKTVNGHYFYGWMEVYWDGVFYSEGKMIYVDRIAFCTIPNYPLVWGQTEIQPQPPIIYTDYEPDSLVELKQYDLYPESKMMIDFDFDSIPDIRITYYAYGTGGYWYDIRSYEPEWELHEYEVGDTLMPMDDPELRWSTRILWERYFYNEIDTISDKFAVRHKVGDSYYYGWFRAYITMCPPSPYPWVALDKMAYCTIPDYPLIWGQTSLDQIGEEGAEWYYEILNDNGSITYQHLECAADTTINGERPKIIIRSNTQYDKDLHTEVTHEYIYEENGVVYWWNKTLEEFTMLYNLAAEVGDEWEIKVGAESLTMHVDAVENIDYEGRTFRMLRVSDENDLFSGNIVCGIGHLTSFFPERLMNRGKNYRVEGMRCYWVNGDLTFKIGDEDCDAIYEEWHGIEEDGPSTGSGTFTVYPNPADNVLFVEMRLIASLPTAYRITNLTGQNLLSGYITVENQQIDVSVLPKGMYFISVGNVIQKFVVRQ